MIENFKDKINTKGFDKNKQNINRTGANRKPMSAILKELIDGNYIEFEIILTTSDGNKKIEKLKLQSKTDLKEAINFILIKKALSGDLRAIQEIMDRTEGKALQKIEQKTEINHPLNIQVTSQRAKENLERLINDTDE